MKTNQTTWSYVAGSKTFCAILMALSVGFVSCGDDEPTPTPESEPVPTETSPELAPTGVKRICYYNDTEGKYDANGNLLEWNGFTVTYNPMKMTRSSEYSNNVISDIQLNSDGFITHYKETYSDTDGYEYDGECNITYDSEGHAVHVDMQEHVVDEDGETAIARLESTKYYSGGSLQKIELYEEVQSEEDDYYERYDEVVTVENSTVVNTYNIAEFGGYYPNSVKDLEFTGLFGHGPQFMPAKYSVIYTAIEYDDDERYTEEETAETKLTYTLNADGSIAAITRNTVYGDGESYSVTYQIGYWGEWTSNAQNVPTRSTERPLSRRHLRMKHHRIVR